jgi:hypothetical protein
MQATTFSDTVRALRQSFPMAAIIAAIAEALGVSSLEYVATAMEDCKPLPAWRPERSDAA